MSSEQQPRGRCVVRFAPSNIDSSSSTSDDTARAEVVCTIALVPLRSEYSPHERSRLWWQRHELDEIKSSAQLIGRECRRAGYGVRLEGVFGVNGTRRREEKRCDPSQAALNVWSVSGHSRRGLEQMSNKYHREIRKECQVRAIRAVLKEQHAQRESGRWDPAKLASTSERYTEGARTFASMMGKADEHAARMQHVKRNISGFLVRSPPAMAA